MWVFVIFSLFTFSAYVLILNDFNLLAELAIARGMGRGNKSTTDDVGKSD